jgi:hypothetical protein
MIGQLSAVGDWRPMIRLRMDLLTESIEGERESECTALARQDKSSRDRIS